MSSNALYPKNLGTWWPHYGAKANNPPPPVEPLFPSDSDQMVSVCPRVGPSPEWHAHCFQIYANNIICQVLMWWHVGSWIVALLGGHGFDPHYCCPDFDPKFWWPLGYHVAAPSWAMHEPVVGHQLPNHKSPNCIQ